MPQSTPSVTNDATSTKGATTHGLGDAKGELPHDGDGISRDANISTSKVVTILGSLWMGMLLVALGM